MVGSNGFPYWREKSLPEELVLRLLLLPGSPLIILTERKIVLLNSISQSYVNPNLVGAKIPHALDSFLAELTL